MFAEALGRRLPRDRIFCRARANLLIAIAQKAAARQISPSAANTLSIILRVMRRARNIAIPADGVRLSLSLLVIFQHTSSENQSKRETICFNDFAISSLKNGTADVSSGERKNNISVTFARYVAIASIERARALARSFVYSPSIKGNITILGTITRVTRGYVTSAARA